MEITPAMTNEVFDAQVASLNKRELSFCLRCPHCNKPVDLCVAMTDERGKAVHEECYVRTLLPSLF